MPRETHCSSIGQLVTFPATLPRYLSALWLERQGLHVLRVYVQCALGTLIASGGSLTALASHLHVHLSFAVLLFLGLAIARLPGGHTRGAGTLLLILGGGITVYADPIIGAIYGLTVLFDVLTLSSWQHRRPLWGTRRLTLGLSHGLLPFLAGYLAAGYALSPSAWLLSLGFLGLSLGVWPSRLMEEDWQPSRADGNRSTWQFWIGPFLLGLAAILAWLWDFCPFPTGILLACPGALWILMLVSGHVSSSADQPQRLLYRRHANLAWVTLVVALATASAL